MDTKERLGILYRRQEALLYMYGDSDCEMKRAILDNKKLMDEIKKEIRTLQAEDRPEYGKRYSLTGGVDTPSIINGNTGAESEVKGACIGDISQCGNID